MKRTELESPEAAQSGWNHTEHPHNGITEPDALEAELAERPSTFELAQLAATLATRPEQISPAEVVLEALQLWDAALKARITEKQEREIWRALFLDNKEQWERRLKSYVGDKYGLYDLLSEPRYQVEAEVLPNIFHDPNETPDTRREKFAELVQFAQLHHFFSPTEGALQHARGEGNEDARQLQASENGQDLLAGKFNALAVRMLVEAEQQRRQQMRP